MLFFILYLALRNLTIYMKGAQSLNWMEADAEVTDVSIRKQNLTVSGGAGVRKAELKFPKIKYSYTVNGEHYTSEKIRHFCAEFSLSKNEIEKLNNDFEKGKKITVYVSPDYSDSVIYPGSDTKGFLISNLTFIFIFTILILWYLK